ncbi:hypothetical protein Nepgr_024788 [Nepenthes gracilis]|uniref:Uncharacterized protein n=1 Tax=Nepenthes gracilis TaxID=150966 RepID=A0AAD3T4R5_NEPGR|nr:hypothetical protein Nepgr_024788 [Nepenthes gracilis]
MAVTSSRGEVATSRGEVAERNEVVERRQRPPHTATTFSSSLLHFNDRHTAGQVEDKQRKGTKQWRTTENVLFIFDFLILDAMAVYTFIVKS